MKPTSQHIKRVEEERARLILEHFFPEKYVHTILFEAPDIIAADDSIGVEVTNSTVSELRRTMSDVLRSAGKPEELISRISRKSIDKRHVISIQVPDGKNMTAFTMRGNTYDVAGAYQKKIRKLNSSHFTKCRENNLFIYAWLADKPDLLFSIEEMLALIKEPEHPAYDEEFDIIYVFSQLMLFKIQVSTGRTTLYQMAPEDLNEISKKAFYNIFHMSREEYQKEYGLQTDEHK